MNHLVVHRNTDMPREPSITKERAPAPGFCHQLCAGLVDIFRGDPRTKHRRKLLKDSACQFARGAHLLNFLRCLDWDHATISWLTSLKSAPPARDWRPSVAIYLVYRKSLRPRESIEKDRTVALVTAWKNDSPLHRCQNYLWFTNMETATPATANSAKASHIHNRTPSFTTLPDPPTARSKRPRMRPLRKK